MICVDKKQHIIQAPVSFSNFTSFVKLTFFFVSFQSSLLSTMFSAFIFFGIIFMNWGKYRIKKLKECSLMSQIDKLAIYRTVMESENI